MRTHVIALTCAVALAGALGVASADAQKTTDANTTNGNDRATTTFSGCLERNAYDQYVLTSASRNGAETSPGSASAPAASSSRYELLLGKDLNLAQDVGKRVQVTGHVLEGQELRRDVGTDAERAVGTSGTTNANGPVIDVVGVQQTSGDCAPQTPQR